MIKMQVNLPEEKAEEIRQRARNMLTSESAVMRAYILHCIDGSIPIIENNRQQYENKVVDQCKPEKCPNCQKSEDELGNPVLVFSSNRRWQCFNCRSRGTY